MENLNTDQAGIPANRTSYEIVKKQRDDLLERLKIEQEKREALENKIASFFDPIIERSIDDHVTNFKEDLEEKVYELESRIDDIDNEVDISEMVATELNELIRDNRLTVKIELD